MKLPDKISIFQITESRLLFFLLFLFIILNSFNIKYPGIQYDEVLFVNAALGGIDNSFTRYSIGGFPILLMPYIGALKAYLYMPIFFIFGVSPASIRLPTILLTAVSIYILFKTIHIAFNRKIAWITFILLVLDQNIAAHTRIDVGPNAIEFFLKSLCLLLLFKIYTTGKRSFIVLLFCIFVLGVFNKLNFAWFIISLMIAAAVLFSDTIKTKIKNREFHILAKHIFIYISALIPFLIYFLVLNAKFDLPVSFSFDWIGLTFPKKLINIINIIQGDSFYHNALGNIKNPAGTIYLFFVIAILACGSIIAVVHKNRDIYYTKKTVFLWLIIVTTIIQIIINPRATKTWHAFTIQPVLPILLALCVYNTALFFKNLNYSNEKTITYIILFFVIAYNIVLISYYQKAYYKRKNIPFFSEAIYDLIDYTKKNKGKYFSADWGIHNQLIAFNQDKESFNEIYHFFLDKRTRERTKEQAELFFNTCLREKYDEHYFIVREHGAYNPKAKNRLFKIAHLFGIALKEHKRFSDYSSKKDIFVIYSVQ